MPELPEVETIVRSLRPILAGRSILSARLNWERSLAWPEPAVFRRSICGQQLLEVSRRAKFLHFRLSTSHLIIHLRMSGDMQVVPAGSQPGKHDHLILELSGKESLVFSDPRKFGRVWLVDDPGQVFGRLGPEPLAEEFTPAWLYDALHARRRQLKPLLLDQTFLAGLGNIYTDESLHMAHLHPLAVSDSITLQEAGALCTAIREVLQEGIRRNGASIDWVYRGGNFQNHFRVYHRQGLPCPTCGAKIEHILVGQRSTHFCPVCQALQNAENPVK